MTRPTTFDAIVEPAAVTHGVPAALLYALIAQESNWRPNARRAEPRIKDASHGLMQLLGKTARSLGYDGPIGDPGQRTGLYDPAINIDLGARLLAQLLHQTGGDLAAAVSAYNGGYRPQLGFGAPAPKALTVCLARDRDTGHCILRHEVKPGEYANQPYVNAVLARYRAWSPA